ncbi:MAG: TIGR03663 family protein [Chloroflexi bacterium]|nr:TIGR03663 family protein [Chloroflexota bacterium]
MAEERVIDAGRETPGLEEGETRPQVVSPMSRWEWAFLAALLLVALMMRLWDLGSRAIHHDESLIAWFSYRFSQGQGYVHDPMMHGPFQFHGNALVFFLFGDSDFTARLQYTLFGTALVALPFLLRPWLGRWGTIMVSLLLAFSPTMLYFSRFARNDIIMAVWTLGLVTVLWRYLEEGKHRYLFLGAALLALMFSTKETSYIVALGLGSFLFVLATLDLGPWLLGRRRLAEFSRAGSFLILMITLTLPLWAPLTSLVDQIPPLKEAGLVLANSDWTKGRVGMPMGVGIPVAAGVVTAFLVASVYVGLRWSWRRWLLAAAIYYAIWLLLYTTVFTNLLGIGSGMWQSMGYWIAQQGVARGGQPWYYYFVIGWTYEFLPFLFAVIGGIYYVLKRDRFGQFLIYWALVNFLLFTWASEKMPWLLVMVALPLIVLGGRFLGHLIESVPWRQAWEKGAILALPLVSLFILLFLRLLLYEPERGEFVSVLSVTGLALVLIALLGGALYTSFRLGNQGGASLLGLSLALFLLVLTVRAGWRVTYINGDVPVEMLVYTQTSPDIPRLAREVASIAKTTGEGENLKITVDGADGFAWPWVWYFRRYKAVGYPDLNNAEPDRQAAVLLVNAGNDHKVRPKLEDDYTRGQRYRHRWWFPESYRGVTPGKFWAGLTDRRQWRTTLDYWLYRKIDTALGSVDAYAYFRKGLTAQGP